MCFPLVAFMIFSFIFGVQQFSYCVLRHFFFFFSHSAWGLPSFLNPEIIAFHHIWKILNLVSLAILPHFLFLLFLVTPTTLMAWPSGNHPVGRRSSALRFNPMSLCPSDWITSVGLFRGHSLFPSVTMNEPVFSHRY